MRTKEWKRKRTFRSIYRKSAILRYRDLYQKEKYINERNRLDKVSVSDLEHFDRIKYNRSDFKRDTLTELRFGLSEYAS